MKQLLVSLGLISSLLIGHASACACSHHVEAKAIEPSDCHSHHETTEAVETAGDGNVCGTTCVCVVEQPSPYEVSNTTTKEFKASDKLAKPGQTLPEIEFVATTAYTQLSPEFINDLSYASILRSLVPARAPPRL